MIFTVIGSCSNCGGSVTVPTAWYGMLPPIPRCQRCGAVAKTCLPVVPMTPVPAKPLHVYDENGKIRFIETQPQRILDSV